jgi:hypothetical protein
MIKFSEFPYLDEKMALRQIFLHAGTMDQTAQSGADTFIPAYPFTGRTEMLGEGFRFYP